MGRDAMGKSANRFASLRWRLMMPLLGLSLVMIVVIVYAGFSAGQQENAAAITQFTGLILAILAAGAVITTFIVLSWLIGRIKKITRVAEALAAGELTARTGMHPTDEVSRMGHALDQYADRVQNRQNELRASSRQGRREVEQLTAAMEALPDGIIVQDLDGTVQHINTAAKNLLDVPSGLRSAIDEKRELELTEFITQRLGHALPLLGVSDARWVTLNAGQPELARELNVSTTPMTSMSHHRIGTLVVLRDMSSEVERARVRDSLLNQMNAALENDSRPIVPLREAYKALREAVETNRPTTANDAHRPFSLDRFVLGLVNEWRQPAQSANLTLDLVNERPGLIVMGDERRLRYAIACLLDNAVKYTPPGGKVLLEIKGEEKGMARLRLRDNGTGIAADELPHVFTRFYRGTPTTTGGRVIRVPGAGQGLTLAKEIIEGHGGTITIRSQVGMGTAVYFTLPTTENS